MSSPAAEDDFLSLTVTCSVCDRAFVLRLLRYFDDPVPDREPVCPSCLIDSDDDDVAEVFEDGDFPIDTISTVDGAIPTVLMTEGSSCCVVCNKELAVGCLGRRLPCSHVYHSECILPWLCNHNSCPLCRSCVVSVPDAMEEADGPQLSQQLAAMSLG